MKKNRLFTILFLTLTLAAFVRVQAAAEPADTTPEITFNTVSVIDVKLGSAPDKTTYSPGDSPDYTGATLNIYYNNGLSTTEAVMSSWCSGFDSSVFGECTVTVSYPGGGPSVKFTVTVSEPSIGKIAITKLPKKTSYLQGEAFDASGLAVSATYANGTVADITQGCTVQQPDMSLPGEAKEVYVFYYSGGKRYQTSFTVEVRQITAVSASVGRLPDKLVYGDGEKADFSGLKVDAVFTDGTKEFTRTYEYPSPDFTVSGFDSGKLGTVTLTVECRGFTMNFEVRIIKSANHVHVPGEYVEIVPADCLHPGREAAVCEICGEPAGEREIPLSGHTFDEWYIVSPATVYAPGRMTRRCTVCGATEEAAIPQIVTEEITTEPAVPTEPAEITTDAPVTGTDEPALSTGPDENTTVSEYSEPVSPDDTSASDGGVTSGDILKIVLIVIGALVLVAFVWALVYNRFGKI